MTVPVLPMATGRRGDLYVDSDETAEADCEIARILDVIATYEAPIRQATYRLPDALEDDDLRLAVAIARQLGDIGRDLAYQAAGILEELGRLGASLDFGGKVAS